ncbi:MAG: oxygen-dependent coproporphyrinogen oxidase [Bacteroidetes bacterium]|nr:oxygen-dependent coproporphyrinogen oxidase [Bacteroidota bacterium]MBS1931004.1 oxygen-dependent coproporphyrinogen oxidase [Bacteroidota bacterium]
MLHKTETKELRNHWLEIIYGLQDKICKALEDADGKATFKEDEWQRTEACLPDRQGKGGGGLTRVIADGNVFEKGGVNTSVVYGKVTDAMRRILKITSPVDKSTWFAAGLSLVIHPINPFVPTIHCNYRMFELYEDDMFTDRWFGGGTDLTPYYLFEEDAKYFHQTYKNVCDEFDPSFYSEFKKECDDYFVNTHRNNERRGIGGIFYDHKRPDEKRNTEFWMNFGKACGEAFIHAYISIVEKRKYFLYNANHKRWQEIRRGRYVEFNLIHDRGTVFGLKTGGRTESILMSLPPTVRFEYDYHPEPGSEEDKLLQVCLNPVEWVPQATKGEF